MKPSLRTLFLLLPSAALLALPAPAEIVERVVAAVNGDIITLSEFEARQIAAVQAARVPPDQIPAFLRENNARLLQEAVDELLILQRGDQLGIRLRAEYIDSVIGDIKRENNIATDAELREQLRQEGMTLEDLKRSVERSIVQRQVLSSELSTVALTEAEARAYYDAHVEDEFTRPATARLQQILISGDREDAAERAQEVLARARAGEDFAALAREYSDSPTASSGGEIGTLIFGEMNPEIERIARELPPGGISEPRSTPNGSIQILRVVEKTEGSIVPFDTVKQDVLTRLAERRRAEEYDAYIEGLRENAVVDVRVREVGLQLDLPAESTLLEDAREAAGPATPGAALPADEFSVSGSSAPRRIDPDGVSSSPVAEPAPEPSPSPTPPE